MDKAAKWLSIFAALALIIAAYLITSARLTAVMTSVSAQSAAERLDTFGPLVEAIERGDLDDNQYAQLTSDDPGDYAFVTYTVTLSSRCPLAAEWAVLSLSPIDGDIAFVPGDAQDVPPFGERSLNATLLTTREAANAPRQLWVEYYVFGRLVSAVVEAP